jgi:hypothetical protein
LEAATAAWAPRTLDHRRRSLDPATGQKRDTRDDTAPCRGENERCVLSITAAAASTQQPGKKGNLAMTPRLATGENGQLVMITA